MVNRQTVIHARVSVPFYLVVLGCLLVCPVRADFNLRMQTDLGALDILMLDSVAPMTVANFMNYANRGDYDRTFIHRSIPGFVVQGGGYVFSGVPGTFFSGGTVQIPKDPPVINEFNLSNLRGTLAMAKLPTGPDTATSEWFFNLADNSANLDVQNGGFTVFAQVQGAGMDVVDDIAALPTCPQLLLNCFTAYSQDVPLVSAAQIGNEDLINIYVGVDNDGDGAIDRLEDAGPSGGDANGDAIQDSIQAHVASYPGEGGSYVVVESAPATALADLSHQDASFYLANPAGTYDLLMLAQASGMKIMRGYAGFDVTGLAPGGAATVTVTLPAGDAPDSFFNYGPTPSNPLAHWYEFNYDGTTGAVFAGNVITLHYVDGLRGDADLDNGNGLIAGSTGGAGVMPADLDGVAAAIEDGAPNGGDGNNDAIADSIQSDVTSLPDVGSNYVTLEALQPAQTLHYIAALDGTSLGINPGIPGPPQLAGYNFENGFFEIHIANVSPGGAAEVKISLPAGALPDTYFMFGPEPGILNNHWYQFDFDPATGTGAVINGNEVTLHFVDGERGDADLVANGVIADPGGPATSIINTNAVSGSSSGCVLRKGVAQPGQAGAWCLLLLLGTAYAIRRKYRH